MSLERAERAGGRERNGRRAIAQTPARPRGERRLMEHIYKTCGAEILAAENDAARAGLLAAIAASESGGCRYRQGFSHGIFERLEAVIAGREAEHDGVRREALKKALGEASEERERAAALKKLAGLYGLTQIPGYCAVKWGVTVEELAGKERHFEFAARRLRELCKKYGLDTEKHVAEIGRWWNRGDAEGRRASGLYGWRLRERMRVWGETVRGREADSEQAPGEESYESLRGSVSPVGQETHS